MIWSEMLLLCVLVMLIASIYMGFCINRALFHSRMAMRSLRIEYAVMKELCVKFDQRMDALETRIKELET